MKTLQPPQKRSLTENLIYISIWLLVLTALVFNTIRMRSFSDDTLFDATVALNIVKKLLPFITLFLVNNFVLFPKLLMRGHNKAYFFSLAAVLAVIVFWQSQQIFMDLAGEHRLHGIPRRGMRPRLDPGPVPIPMVLDFLFDLLILGMNLSVGLIFQRYYDRIERESLSKANAETRLAYLKAQINPHFYMNMLNNIHGMIEINPEKAQEMVLDMSALMRYMLYESSQTRIPLTREIGFLKNYLRIMRQRFPESRVAISSSFPDDIEASAVTVPPLLFLVFIENAFKHGVSYRESSFVSVAVTIADRRLAFTCMNSDHHNPEKSTGGIGLENVRQRLKLIYGHDYSLDISASDKTFTTILRIPTDDKAPDTDNR